MRLLLHIFAAAALLGSASLSLAGEQTLAHDVRSTKTPARRTEEVQVFLPPAIIEITGGWFVMGSSEAEIKIAIEICKGAGDGASRCNRDLFSDEYPQRKVYLSRYRIDRTEVSRNAYRQCVQANACPPSRVADTDQTIGQPTYPVTAITWREARRYCQWRGGDLPTEAQWERAARVSRIRLLPWGHHYKEGLANHGANQPGTNTDDDGYTYAAPVDAFDAGKSANGLLNLAGNVWELVRDSYAADQYRHSTRINPLRSQSGERVMRGGSWASPIHALRTTSRAKINEEQYRSDIGFRCVYDVP
jgi:formylglycine-generating enzyme